MDLTYSSPEGEEQHGGTPTAKIWVWGFFFFYLCLTELMKFLPLFIRFDFEAFELIIPTSNFHSPECQMVID